MSFRIVVHAARGRESQDCGVHGLASHAFALYRRLTRFDAKPVEIFDLRRGPHCVISSCELEAIAQAERLGRSRAALQP